MAWAEGAFQMESHHKGPLVIHSFLRLPVFVGFNAGHSLLFGVGKDGTQPAYRSLACHKAADFLIPFCICAVDIHSRSAMSVDIQESRHQKTSL